MLFYAVYYQAKHVLIGSIKKLLEVSFVNEQIQWLWNALYFKILKVIHYTMWYKTPEQILFVLHAVFLSCRKTKHSAVCTDSFWNVKEPLG